jgi:hypothetical protein
MTTHRPKGDAAAQLRAALHTSLAGPDDELLPDRLAAACATVLGADGAGVSLVDGKYRLPLGASDEVAALAERLQFTLGEGPCLEAAAHGQVTVAGMPEIALRWPAMADELASRTPYRAIVCLPLPLGPHMTGALDLYLADAGDADAIGLSAATAVAQEAARVLGPAADSAAAKDPRPPWAGAPSAAARGSVWIAAGMVMADAHLSARDALAVLRAYAYARTQTLEDTAAALTAGALQPGDVTS